ncbi:hypothetical protein FPL11_06375 [Spiribacter aquaticus]|uniref:Uncharacterized protein n=1 Tax=Spiribacter aquaticus TaxID=1935996 RepID=A0A557RKJ0_9GAMM|nr:MULTISPECIES: hypothetical protein [Spiribacter]KAF0279798.1 hypothetical protein BA897_03385 [Spiribacter roseus]TVO65681.1 hypothetical protein FPL11_06375 [Spiribacter aquaticus]
MYQTSNHNVDWDLVFHACRLKNIGLTHELFIQDPWNILRALDMLDAIETLEAGELPVPAEPPPPAFWDRLYDRSELIKRGLNRQRFKYSPWVYVMRHGCLDVLGQLYRRWAARGRRASHDIPIKAPKRCGIVHRITDGLAVIVDAFYPLALTTEGRWRVDRERIVAMGERYRMRLLFLSLINALAYVMVYEMGESLISEVAMLALVGITTAGMVRLGAVEASVEA